MRDIGKNIRSLREGKNLTQDQLAEKLFVTRQTVSNYETGRSRPDIDMLLKIAEVLDVDIHIVLYGPQTDPDLKKKRLRFVVAAVLFLLWLLLLHDLQSLAEERKQMLYDPTLKFLLDILALPATAFAGGWLVVQGLHLFAKLSPLRVKFSRHMRWTILALILGYAAVMAPFLLRMASVPTWWVKTALFILGALLPGQLGGGYVFAFFLFGAALRLFRPAGQT